MFECCYHTSWVWNYILYKILGWYKNSDKMKKISIIAFLKEGGWTLFNQNLFILSKILKGKLNVFELNDLHEIWVGK